jgi:23S rRNA G2069 N7-methylase RlmK/C1962 C5-methylase RlmI
MHCRMASLPRRVVPRRYQLNKAALHVLATGHPWIFRSQLSSAAQVFEDGQWLRLVDGTNAVVGYGVYAAAGAIAIRVLKRGSNPPDAVWTARRVEAALARRAELRSRTDAFRAVHGENDGLAGVVVDVYGAEVVLQTYAAGLDALGRVAAARVRREVGARRTWWKPAVKRRGELATRAPRLLAGGGAAGGDGVVAIREDGLTLHVDLLGGQKSGAFLDLRGLRRWVAGRDLGGRRVLNLFSYTGAIARAAEVAGAREIWSVDASEPALAFGARHHAGDAARHRWIAADVFDWLPQLDEAERFDLIIVDPPQMTSRSAQVARALAGYRHLYRSAVRHVAPGGFLIACCCTSRIPAARFREVASAALEPRMQFVERLPPEPDHPVAFREADYLKILVYEATR